MNATATPRTILLDTNTVLHLARNQKVGQWLVGHYALLGSPTRCLTCRVVHGEMRSFLTRAKAKGQPWSERKAGNMLAMLDQMPTVELDDPGVLNAYADLVAYTEVICKPARPMGKNDLWIAAAAKVTKATLLTGDGDFDHLHNTQITVEKYDSQAIMKGAP